MRGPTEGGRDFSGEEEGPSIHFQSSRSIYHFEDIPFNRQSPDTRRTGYPHSFIPDIHFYYTYKFYVPNTILHAHFYLSYSIPVPTIPEENS